MANATENTQLDPEAVRLGQALRNIRKNLPQRWPLWKLGPKVGRSRTNLSNIECGRRTADAPLLYAIAQVYGMPIETFLDLLYPPDKGLQPPAELVAGLRCGEPSKEVS